MYELFKAVPAGVELGDDGVIAPGISVFGFVGDHLPSQYSFWLTIAPGLVFKILVTPNLWLNWKNTPSSNPLYENVLLNPP
ncbi:hypothetical protein D3C72_2388570 [compost metagenome]